MFGQKARGALIALTFVSLSAPQAEACNWLKGCFGGTPQTAYYAPTVAAYAPSPCCQPAPVQQVVNYMPQTCYRTVYVNTPVVTYRPVAACGPCGTPTTVMRPVTSFVMQPRVVPYTTYRPVVTANYAPMAPACGGCAAAAPVQAAAYYAPAPVAAPACCGAGTGAPSLSNYAPAPAVSGYAPQAASGYAPQGAVGSTITSLSPPPASQPTTGTFNASPPSTLAPPTGVPSLAPVPNQNSTPSTFDPSQPAAEPESRTMQPLKLAPSSSNNGAPRALDPEDQDRTTALPLHQTWAARPVSTISPNTPATAPSQGLDDSGWRTARH